MNKFDPLGAVSEFHKTFDHPIENAPVIPSKQRCELRVALLKEELAELEKGILEGNLVEVADAFCDLQYVLSGAILEFGLGEKFTDLFAEVQRSNMSKACGTLEEAEQTAAYFLQKENVECHVRKIENKYLVYRNRDNKVMKSLNYSPANLQKILNES